MHTLFINIIFLIITLSILGNTISYGIYEYKQEKNHFGGIFVIVFSIISILFSNIIIWIK